MLPFLLNPGLTLLKKEQVQLVVPGYGASPEENLWPHVLTHTLCAPGHDCRGVSQSSDSDRALGASSSSLVVVSWQPLVLGNEDEQKSTHSLEAGTWRSREQRFQLHP